LNVVFVVSSRVKAKFFSVEMLGVGALGYPEERGLSGKGSFG